jgi:hypothetical protein
VILQKMESKKDEKPPTIGELLQEIKTDFFFEKIEYEIDQKNPPTIEEMKEVLELMNEVCEINKEKKKRAIKMIEQSKIHDDRINDYLGKLL